MKINNYFSGVLLLSVVVFLTGCATRVYVREYVEDKLAPFDNRVGRLETKTSELEKEASAQRDKVEGMGKRLSHVADDVKVTALDAKAAKDMAEATASHLATKPGIDRNKIIVLTFGESVPTAPNNTKEGREQNRRVEITVYTDTLE